jgi:hypothetical protein
MNPGATENLSHLWVLDKFRVVQRLALIFLRVAAGGLAFDGRLSRNFPLKSALCAPPAKLASAMRRRAASDPSRRLNLRTSSTISALIRLGSATKGLQHRL